MLSHWGGGVLLLATYKLNYILTNVKRKMPLINNVAVHL